MQTKSFRVAPAQDGERIDVFLVQFLSGLSRKRIKSVLDAGGVYVNRRRVQRAGHTLSERDLIEVHWDDSSRVVERPALEAASIVFSNEDFLVVNKPAGLPSQATIESVHGTVIEALRQDVGVEGELFLVHRLDKETSGLLIVARTKAARAHFEDLFQKRIVQKTYLGLTAGVPAQGKGEISAAIQKDPLGTNRYRIVRAGGQEKKDPRRSNRGGSFDQGGRVAQTQYEVLSSAPSFETALLSFKPRTGRTHQIRVHCAQFLGCPILGDKTYGRVLVGHPLHRAVRRHLLHAWKLKFPLPSSEDWFSLEAPVPADFREVCLETGLNLALV